MIAGVGVSVDKPLHDVDLQGADVHLLAPLALAGVQGLHTVDVVPDGHIPAARGDDHKRGWQAAVPIQTFGQLNVLVVGVDVLNRLLDVHTYSPVLERYRLSPIFIVIPKSRVLSYHESTLFF